MHSMHGMLSSAQRTVGSSSAVPGLNCRCISERDQRERGTFEELEELSQAFLGLRTVEAPGHCVLWESSMHLSRLHVSTHMISTMHVHMTNTNAAACLHPLFGVTSSQSVLVSCRRRLLMPFGSDQITSHHYGHLNRDELIAQVYHNMRKAK